MQKLRANSARSAYIFVSVNLILLLVFLVLGTANIRNIQQTLADYDEMVHSWFLFRVAASRAVPLSHDELDSLPEYGDFAAQLQEIRRSQPVVAAAALSDTISVSFERVASVWRELQVQLGLGFSPEMMDEQLSDFQDALLSAKEALSGFVQTQDRSMSLLLFCLGSTVLLIIVVFVAVERESQRARIAAQRSHLLAQTTLAAQEHERKRIARALHDSLAQDLSLASLETSQLGHDGTDLPDRLSARLERAIQWVRNLAYELRPAEIDNLGLLAAVREYCRDHASGSGVSLTWSLSGEDRHIDSDTAINVYRIAQESLTNAIRHSGGQNIHLWLAAGLDRLELTVTDDGAGFSPMSTTGEKPGRGLGITGMEERAEMVCATLEFKTAANGGAEVHLVVPLRNRPERKVEQW